MFQISLNRNSQTRMTNDEIRRNTEIQMTNGQLHTRAPFDIRASDFFRHSSFDNSRAKEIPGVAIAARILQTPAIVHLTILVSV